MSNVTNPTQPQQQTYVTDPYGSGATFSWQGNRIPQAGDPDFVEYNQKLSIWLQQREQVYRESPQYQQDQAHTNPDIASGKVPSVGFVAEGPNAWNIPVGAKVTALEKQEDGGYNFEFKERGTPQEVTVSGPGYSMTSTVYAKDAREAAAIVMGSASAQYMGVDVSPSRIGGQVIEASGNKAVIQAGNPEQNKYWEGVGLPQYAGYSIPKLTAEQEAAGFYVKDVKAAGTAPAVTVANRNWEKFWGEQGLSQYSNYEPPNLREGDYLKSVTQTEHGVTYTIGNRQAEAKAASDQAKLTDINQRLQTINTQNRVFSENLAIEKITPSEYQKAMLFQNQNTLGLLNEAEALGFISATDKQAQANQMNEFMTDIDFYVKGYNTYKATTSKISRENEVFAAKLQSGDITQTEYNKALGYQNQQQITAIKQASIEGIISPETAKAATVDINLNYQQFLNAQKVNAPFSAPTVSGGLANAVKMSEIKAQSSTFTARQGTRTTGFTEAQILATLTPEEQKVYMDQKTQQAIFKGVSASTFVLVGATAPFGLPTSISLKGLTIVAKDVILGAGLSVGFNEMATYSTTQTWLTPQQAAISAGEGALFALIGRGGLYALSKVAPTVSASILGQAAVNTPIGAGVNYFVSGGDPLQTVIGGASALAFTFAGAGLGRVNARYGITERVTSPISERITNTVLKNQRVLGRLDAIQTNYETSVKANQLPRYSTTDRLTMELADAYPIRGKPQFVGLPTTPTTTEWRVNEKGFITDKFASDMGVTVKTSSKTVIPETARGPNIWEGELTLQRGEVIRYKTLAEAELADPSTSFIGRSESPETLYATERTVTQASLGSSPQKSLGETTQKVKVKTQAEKNFETNRAVDDYLASISDDVVTQPAILEQEVIATQPVNRILNENVKVVNPGIRGKVANEVQAQIEAEELGIPRNARYADPADFDEARRLFQQTRGEITAEPILTEAAQPTGISKVASEIEFNRTVDTSRYGIRGNINTIKAFMVIPETEANVQAEKTETNMLKATELTALTEADTLRLNLLLSEQPIKATATENIIQPYPNINIAENFTAQPKTKETTAALINTFIGTGLEANKTPEPITDLLTQTELSPQLETALQTKTLTALEEQRLTELQEALSMPPITAKITLADSLDYPTEETEDSRKRRKKKSEIDEILETFTAFRTTAKTTIDPLSKEVVKRRPGVEKQVVTAKLVSFYPTTNTKIPKNLKAPKADNEYFRAITVNGVRGIGTFKGTGRALDFYPAGKKKQPSSIFDIGDREEFQL